MGFLRLIRPQNGVGFLEMKTCKMRKRRSTLLFDQFVLISIMMIFISISLPISWAADETTSSQTEDIVTGQESSIKGKLHQECSC